MKIRTWKDYYNLHQTVMGIAIIILAAVGWVKSPAPGAEIFATVFAFLAVLMVVIR